MWPLRHIHISFIHTHTHTHLRTHACSQTWMKQRGKVWRKAEKTVRKEVKRATECENERNRVKWEIFRKDTKRHLWKGYCGHWLYNIYRSVLVSWEMGTLSRQSIMVSVFITERLIFLGKIPYPVQKEHNHKSETALALFSPTQKSSSSVWPSMQNSSFLKLSSSLLKSLGYKPWERISRDRGTVLSKWHGKHPATITLSEGNTVPSGHQKNL